MLAKKDMMGLLLEACPSFTSTWQKFLDDYQDEVELPLYLAFGDLARHLIELVERGEIAELPAVFQVVERWHVEGDEYVRNAATVGVLEDLQNGNLHQNGTTPAQFRAMLGPESARCWDSLEAQWEEVFRWRDRMQAMAPDEVPEWH